MEYKELIASLISTAITAVSIIIIWLIQFAVKKFSGQKTKNDNLTLGEITRFVMEAEQKLGKGQGAAKMQYVLQKLGKKPKDKKAIKKVNEAHTVLKEAKNIIEADELTKQINESNL